MEVSMRFVMVLLSASLVVPVLALAEGPEAELGPQTGAFFHALEGVNLKPAQAAVIDPLREASKARHDQVREARLALRAKAEDQVRAGTIDRGEMQPLADALARAITGARDADVAALVTVHDTLDAGQRGKVVQALKEKGKEGPPRLQERGRKLAQDVGLTPAQRQELRTALDAKMESLEDPERNAFEERRYLRKQAAEKFAGKKFTAADLPPGEKPEARIERRIVFLETVVPLLTPEQREKAAELLGSDFGER
jgi:Spy/CpxP family protein refolding chaperone